VQKRTDGVERHFGRLQPAGLYNEPVSQAHPHVHACVTAGCYGALALSQRAIQQHFIVASLRPDLIHRPRVGTSLREGWVS
jgi:hypothetical protein